MESIIGKVFDIDELFGVEKGKVKAKLADNGCSGCYFRKEVFSYYFKPAYIGSCDERGINLIFKKIDYAKRRSEICK